MRPQSRDVCAMRPLCRAFRYSSFVVKAAVIIRMTQLG